jgi:hypothetical protein
MKQTREDMVKMNLNSATPAEVAEGVGMAQIRYGARRLTGAAGGAYVPRR